MKIATDLRGELNSSTSAAMGYIYATSGCCKPERHEIPGVFFDDLLAKPKEMWSAHRAAIAE